jgi:hypothetical protein
MPSQYLLDYISCSKERLSTNINLTLYKAILQPYQKVCNDLCLSLLGICDRYSSNETAALAENRFSTLANFQGTRRFQICIWLFKFLTCTII